MIVLNATACAIHLKVKIQLSRVTAFIVINLDATGNFMSSKFAKNY